jgi:ribonucleoside-triphosphate reductase
MQSWCQQNVSATISYSVDEVDDIISWLLDNWDVYVGVSFLFRADPTKTAKDLGYQYLPQAVVTKQEYDEYVINLQDIVLDKANDIDAVLEDDCSTGACPIR